MTENIQSQETPIQQIIMAIKSLGELTGSEISYLLGVIETIKATRRIAREKPQIPLYLLPPEEMLLRIEGKEEEMGNEKNIYPPDGSLI